MFKTEKQYIKSTNRLLLIIVIILSVALLWQNAKGPQKIIETQRIFSDLSKRPEVVRPELVNNWQVTADDVKQFISGVFNIYDMGSMEAFYKNFIILKPYCTPEFYELLEAKYKNKNYIQKLFKSGNKSVIKEVIARKGIKPTEQERKNGLYRIEVKTREKAVKQNNQVAQSEKNYIVTLKSVNKWDIFKMTENGSLERPELALEWGMLVHDIQEQ